MLEPCKFILAIVYYAYELEVPEGTRWHNIVPTTLLQPFRRSDETQDIDEDKEEMWEVEETVNA